MRKINLKTFLAFSLLILSHIVFGQTQTVKGEIKDLQSDYPLIGATILLVGSDPVKGAVTDVNGKFQILDVPAGRQLSL